MATSNSFYGSSRPVFLGSPAFAGCSDHYITWDGSQCDSFCPVSTEVCGLGIPGKGSMGMLGGEELLLGKKCWMGLGSIHSSPHIGSHASYHPPSQDQHPQRLIRTLCKSTPCSQQSPMPPRGGIISLLALPSLISEP